jgi:hypothetical protein
MASSRAKFLCSSLWKFESHPILKERKYKENVVSSVWPHTGVEEVYYLWGLLGFLYFRTCSWRDVGFVVSHRHDCWRQEVIMLFFQLLIIVGACILWPAPGHSSLVHFYWSVSCTETQSFRGCVSSMVGWWSQITVLLVWVWLDSQSIFV